MTLLKYRTVYNNYLQLRAYIDSSLNNPNEMDIFINNTKYSTFLDRLIRDKRRSPAYAYKYTSDQIVETLKTYLQAPDSPEFVANRTRRTSSSDTRPTTPRERASFQRLSTSAATTELLQLRRENHLP